MTKLVKFFAAAAFLGCTITSANSEDSFFKSSAKNQPLSARSLTNFEVRVNTFDLVSKALEAYKAETGKYPTDAVNGVTQNFVGYSEESGKRTGFNALVPKYLPSIPKDPRGNDKKFEQYIYFSNGKDYKFISHGPEDIAAITKQKPAMIDPARSWAYGVWTPGAAKF